MGSYQAELAAHKEIVEILLEGRIPKKEININLWASVAANKLSIPHEVAYKRAKSAGRALQAAGAGRYVEGRRGRESRFRANQNIKEYVQAAFAQAEERAPETKELVKKASAEGFTPEEMAALKRLLQQPMLQKLPQAPQTEKIQLKDFSVEDLLAAVQEKLGEQKS
jgi:hypothetical protein